MVSHRSSVILHKSNIDSTDMDVMRLNKPLAVKIERTANHPFYQTDLVIYHMFRNLFFIFYLFQIETIFITTFWSSCGFVECQASCPVVTTDLAAAALTASLYWSTNDHVTLRRYRLISPIRPFRFIHLSGNSHQFLGESVRVSPKYDISLINNEDFSCAYYAKVSYFIICFVIPGDRVLKPCSGF